MDFTVIHPTDPDKGVRGKLSSPLVITGRVPVRTGQSVRYEGINERLFLETLDFNPSVASIRPQPLFFNLTDHPSKNRYTPDFLVEYSSTSGGPALSPVLIEVKTRNELYTHRENLLPGFHVAIKYCQEQNWRFRIVTDVYLQRPYAKNARFLTHYLRNTYDSKIVDQLKESLQKLGAVSVAELLAINFSDFEEQMLALAVVWHLVAIRQFTTSLLVPLTMNSQIRETCHGKT